MKERDRNLGVAFTGHRQIENDFNLEKLENAVENQIKQGKKYFYVGMALGFDSIAFKVCELLRKKYEIEIIACVPCRDQDKKFPLKDKEEYKRMISSADEVIYVNEKYTNYCMMKRNRYMVDNSSYLIAYLKKALGGTANTVRYAEENDVKVEIL